MWCEITYDIIFIAQWFLSLRPNPVSEDLPGEFRYITGQAHLPVTFSEPSGHGVLR